MVQGLLNDQNESCGGLSLGIGQIFTFGERKNNGFDLDLLCIVTSNAYDRITALKAQGYSIQDIGRVKVSVGYRFSF